MSKLVKRVVAHGTFRALEGKKGEGEVVEVSEEDAERLSDVLVSEAQWAATLKLRVAESELERARAGLEEPKPLPASPLATPKPQEPKAQDKERRGT